MPNPPKRHHYLPQAYLSGFADESGFLAVHDRKLASFRMQKPIDTGIERHLYSRTLPDQSRDAPMEIMLADIDGPFLALRDGLERRVPRLGEKDIAALFSWVAALALRVPRVLEFFAGVGSAALDERLASALESNESAQAFIAEVFGADSEAAQMSLDEIRAYVDELGRKHPRSNSVLHTACEFMNEGRQLLTQKGRITVLRAPLNRRFITADCGALVYHPKPSAGLVGYLGPGSRVLVPISKHVALEMNDGPFGLTRRDIDRDHLSKINGYVAKASQRFVICDNLQRLRAVVSKARLPKVED